MNSVFSMEVYPSQTSFEQLERLGYTILDGVLSAAESEKLAKQLTDALETNDRSVLRSRGQTYGSRDLIGLFPEVRELPRRPSLRPFVVGVLGPRAGLVRALFFDKPPNRTWSLPWHKDRTIAVKRNDLPSALFRRPTIKAGVPHVEAPESLLRSMVTLRLHVDAMTRDNGPLSVIPGSHIAETNEGASHVEIRTEPGAVFAMRPLLSHSSCLPRGGTTMHRRVVHLELAPSIELPDGYEWYSYHRI